MNESAGKSNGHVGRKDRLRKELSDMKILNVGCGEGTYGTHFIDVYPSRDEVIKVDVNDGIPFPDDFFDEVYSNNLFEHLKNVNFVLKDMFRVVKKGGKITVITDNASYWIWSLGNKVHTGFYEKCHQGEKDKHFGLYTPTHLINNFSEIGMKIVSCKYDIDPYEPHTRIKKVGRKIINFILRCTPMWRMAYGRVVVVAIK